MSTDQAKHRKAYENVTDEDIQRNARKTTLAYAIIAVGRTSGRVTTGHLDTALAAVNKKPEKWQTREAFLDSLQEIINIERAEDNA